LSPIRPPFFLEKDCSREMSFPFVRKPFPPYKRTPFSIRPVLHPLPLARYVSNWHTLSSPLVVELYWFCLPLPFLETASQSGELCALFCRDCVPLDLPLPLLPISTEHTNISRISVIRVHFTRFPPSPFLLATTPAHKGRLFLL